jgi:hypothetical protein
MGCVDYEDLDTGILHEGLWRAERNLGLAPVRNVASNNCSTSAAHLRDQHADYFSGAGSVPWKLKAVGTDWIYYYYYCCCLTAIGLTSGGGSTVHIYTQTVHRIQRTEHT